MAIPGKSMASTAHVNMMTDTIIANLPAEGLRAIMRSLLASHPEVTGAFERETRSYIQESALAALNSTGPVVNMNNLKETQYIIRCMVGSGLCFQSLPLLSKLAVRGMNSESSSAESESFLASVDGDIVQTITAVQMTLFVMKGVRKLSEDEKGLLETLYLALDNCQTISRDANREYPYVRGLAATANVSGVPQPTDITLEPTSFQDINTVPLPVEIQETFQLKDRQLPRIFSGLWQMSSPAWGAAPTSKIVNQFSNHVQGGFTAFDMADHYGDAEVIFVSTWSPLTRHYAYATNNRVAFGLRILTRIRSLLLQSIAFSTRWKCLVRSSAITSPRDVKGSSRPRSTSFNSTGSL